MSIKNHGGVFGRNPTFNDVEVEGDLNVEGTFSIGGSAITGLDYEGTWDASSGSAPSASPGVGQFWIVTVAGSTALSGITNWGVGDWALYNGTSWSRLEGGADGNFVNLTSTGTTTLNGTTVPASKTLVVTTDIGSTVQAYDADTAKYDDATAAFEGTLNRTVSVTAEDYSDASEALRNIALTSGVTTNWTIDTIGPYKYLNRHDTGPYNRIYILEPFAGTKVLPAGWTGTVSARCRKSTYTSGGYVKIQTSPDGSTWTDQAAYNDSFLSGGTNVTPSWDNATALTEALFVRIEARMNFIGYTYFGFNHLTITNVPSSENNSIVNGRNITFDYTNGTIAFKDGGGIDFSATSDSPYGSSTSELLDDYEEGTWTPTFGTLYGTESGQVYIDQDGWYTKVGNLVTFGCNIKIDTVGTSAGGTYLMVKGLPFLIGSGATNGVCIGYAQNFNVSVVSLNAWGRTGSSQVHIGYRAAASGDTTLATMSSITTNSIMYISGSYAV